MLSRSLRLAALAALAVAVPLVAACSSAELASSSGGAAVDGGGSTPTPEPGPGPSSPDGAAPADGGADGAPETCAPSGDILGSITSGVCCSLKKRLTDKSPSLENNVLVFTAGETYERAALSTGGQTLYDTANAGGSSTESEVMSYEVLRYCEGATLLKTETEIQYAPPDGTGANSITDILMGIDGKKVGVSVTRMYRPPSQTLTDVDVKDLLEKKLAGVNRSTERVLPADKWVKQILHIFSVNKAATDAIARVWPTIDPLLKADTIVLVTQTAGGGFVYCNPDPPLGSECL